MSRKQNGKKQVYRAVARHRIHYLFSLAETCGLEGNISLSNRYIRLARKISMKYLVPIPKEYAHLFCKYCYSFQLPTQTCRLRIHRGMIVSYCTCCRKYSRRPLHRTSSRSSES